MSKPTRQLITRAELNKLLTRNIRKIEDLEDASLQMRHVLAEPDETGCNWSSDFSLNPGKNGSVEYGAPFATEIVRAARAQFNVKG